MLYHIIQLIFFIPNWFYIIFLRFCPGKSRIKHLIERLSHPLFIYPTVKICQCINRLSHVIEFCWVPFSPFVRRSAINKTTLLDAIKCVGSITKYQIETNRRPWFETYSFTKFFVFNSRPIFRKSWTLSISSAGFRNSVAPSIKSNWSLNIGLFQTFPD